MVLSCCWPAVVRRGSRSGARGVAVTRSISTSLSTRRPPDEPGANRAQAHGAASATFFPCIFEPALTPSTRPAEARHRSRIPGNCGSGLQSAAAWLLSGSAAGNLPHLQREAHLRLRVGNWQCQGTGQVTQMGGRMKFKIPCPRCNGTGKLENECVTCHGEGTISRTETVEVRIKPGTRDGQRIRLAGKGNAGINGGAAGDLYLIIKIDSHPVFNRAGDDIQIEVPVTVPAVALAPRLRCPLLMAAPS